MLSLRTLDNHLCAVVFVTVVSKTPAMPVGTGVIGAPLMTLVKDWPMYRPMESMLQQCSYVCHQELMITLALLAPWALVNKLAWVTAGKVDNGIAAAIAAVEWYWAAVWACCWPRRFQ